MMPFKKYIVLQLISGKCLLMLVLCMYVRSVRNKEVKFTCICSLGPRFSVRCP